nr:MAG: ORF1 [Torque teno virus]
MAWNWWWRRRRRRWPARRRRWRRLRTRRPRRTVRRRRRRPTVRRRRWGRRRGRRTYRRRRRTRRKRKRLVLTQWNPSTVRKCWIRGMFPMLICGHTTQGRNYADHMDDVIPQGRPYGGSLSTTTWTLQALFDQHQRFMNKWSYPNTELDLARYLGTTFWFYRDKLTDYIVTFNIVPPFKLNKYSCPSYHPGMMMQRRKKILVPSFQTKPKGRKAVKVKIGPPQLFEQKWYTQQDLCSVGLVSFAVSAASLTHPFCSPQTENVAVTFQVLKSFYYDGIGINQQTQHTAIQQTLYTQGNYYQTFHTIGFINTGLKPGKKGSNELSSDLKTWITDTFNTGNNSTFGFNSYKPDNTHLSKVLDWYWKEVTADNDITGSYQKANNKHLEYHLGIYSPIYLSPHRSNLQFPTAYQDVTYNPIIDKGVGNQVWFQYNTKPTTEFDDKQCKCHIVDIPLWATFYGYSDYIQTEIGIQQEIQNIGIVCIICPYTVPKLVHVESGKKNWGFVFYDGLFGNGKMPDGSGNVPTYLQQRWHPRMRFQQNVMNDISMSGPFSYKDELKSTVLTCKYKFRFLWGGNLIPQQVVRNPCKSDGRFDIDPHRFPRELQIADPRTMGPQWVFHTWDFRRGLYGKDAIKRVSEKPDDDELYTFFPKKPRLSTPADAPGLQEGGFFFQSHQETTSEEEAEAQEETQAQSQQQQRVLRLQLRQQQQLGDQLRLLHQQVLKTQAGLHLNPLILGLA